MLSFKMETGGWYHSFYTSTCVHVDALIYTHGIEEHVLQVLHDDFGFKKLLAIFPRLEDRNHHRSPRRARINSIN